MRHLYTYWDKGQIEQFAYLTNIFRYVIWLLLLTIAVYSCKTPSKTYYTLPSHGLYNVDSSKKQ